MPSCRFPPPPFFFLLDASGTTYAMPQILRETDGMTVRHIYIFENPSEDELVPKCEVCETQSAYLNYAMDGWITCMSGPLIWNVYTNW